MDIEPKILTNNPIHIPPAGQAAGQVDNPDASFGEGLSAAFRLENTVVSTVGDVRTRADRKEARNRIPDDGIIADGPDPNYDVFDDIEGTHYAAFDRSFIGVENIAEARVVKVKIDREDCLLYTSPSPRDRTRSRMPSSA